MFVLPAATLRALPASGSVLLVGGFGLAPKVRSPMVTVFPVSCVPPVGDVYPVAVLVNEKSAAAPPRLRSVSGFVVLVPSGMLVRMLGGAAVRHGFRKRRVKSWIVVCWPFRTTPVALPVA